METLFLITDINKFFDAINSARAAPKGKGKAKSPLSTPSEWKKFFESSKFIDANDFLPQSTIEAMQKGVGVKDERKVLTLIAALNNAIKKYQLAVGEPIRTSKRVPKTKKPEKQDVK